MKIQLKRSNVLEGSPAAAKEPTAEQMEYGELAVNYNGSDPAVFLKDNNDNIIRIAGTGNINSGNNPSGDTLPPAGNNAGDVFFNTLDNSLYYWDGSQWLSIANDENSNLRFVNITGDNMTGNLTLSTDQITLNAGDGSASFAGKVTSASTVSDDGDTTLVTKDYVESRLAESDTDNDGRYLRTDAAATAQTVQSTALTTFNGSITTENSLTVNGTGYSQITDSLTVGNDVKCNYIASEGGAGFGDVDDHSGLVYIDGGMKVRGSQVELAGGGGDTDALQKQEIEGLIATELTDYVEKSGDNMSGDLTLGPAGAPVISLDATNGFGSSIKHWTTSTTLGAEPGETQEGTAIQPFGRVFVSRASTQSLFKGLQTNVDTIDSPSSYIGSRGDVYFKRNLRIEAGHTPPAGILPEYYYVETDELGATTNVSYPIMLGSLVGNFGDESGAAIFSNIVGGNPIKIHNGGIKRNKGRETRKYGSYGAHYISEGSSNTDCRLALCRNNGGGPASIHFGKTGNYNDTGLDQNTLYYPTTGDGQSLMALSSWFADGYQMVQGARIQTNTVGAVTPGTGLVADGGTAGKAVTNILFDVMDSTGYLGSPNTMTLNAETLYINTEEGVTLNQPNQSIVFTDRGNSKLTYEEGSWSPTVQIGGTDLTPSISNGFYTRVGRNVYVVGRVQGVTLGGNTGKLQIGNLPFQTSGNAVGSISDQGVGQVMLWNSTSGNTIYGAPFIRTNKASFYLAVNYMEQTSLANSSTNLATGQGEDFFATSGDQFRFMCTYICKE